MSSALDRIRALAPRAGTQERDVDWSAPAVRKTAYDNPFASKPAIGSSPELSRILAIPRRDPLKLDITDADGNVLGTTPDAQAIVSLMNDRLGYDNPNCKCAELHPPRPCIKTLLPPQAWTLYEARLANGIAGAVGVGSGKTGLNILTPMVIPNVKVCVLLVPSTLQEQLLRDYDAWHQHFRLPNLILTDNRTRFPKGQATGLPTVYVVAYSMFSRAGSTSTLDQLHPDLIIADEAHKLRYRDTATTGRVIRYLKNNPDTRFCFWSGTITDKSIRDYAHLSYYALKDQSPVPIEPAIVDEWATAIDPGELQAPPGELLKFCKSGETLYDGFHNRLADTRGFVKTSSASFGGSISFSERVLKQDVPKAVNERLHDLRESWQRPDGEEFADALSVAKCALELACGFYYKWKYPAGHVKSQGCECERLQAAAVTPEDKKKKCPACSRLIQKWLDARKSWHRELREKLKGERKEHLDSPLLCQNAAIRYEDNYSGDLPVWRSDSWVPWRDVKDLVDPVSEPVWIDTFLAEDAAQWGMEHKGLIWYDHNAFADKVREISKKLDKNGEGFTVHGGGKDAGKLILAEKGDRSIIVSVMAHSEGRDGLQYCFNKQLWVSPMKSAKEWEQGLGRLHRKGQKEDGIENWVYRHTKELRDSIEEAFRRSKYIQGTLHTYQRLLAADIEWKED